MRFMIIRKADQLTESDAMPSEEILAVMGNYLQQMTDAGILLGGEGLRSTSHGARVKFSQGKPKVLDGPFAETKELIAGWCLIRVDSRDEAIEWAKRWPAVGIEANVELEIRQLHEADDFGEAFTPELREQEERMRAQAAARQ